MSILDRLDKCPFCLTTLVKRVASYANTSDYILDCPKQTNHPNDYLWCWYCSDDHSQINAINIRYAEYQMTWHIRSTKRPEFRVWKLRGSFDSVIVLPYLPDFALDKETIASKLQTILTFS